MGHKLFLLSDGSGSSLLIRFMSIEGCIVEAGVAAVHPITLMDSRGVPICEQRTVGSAVRPFPRAAVKLVPAELAWGRKYNASLKLPTPTTSVSHIKILLEGSFVWESIRLLLAFLFKKRYPFNHLPQ